jgi:hypothetical protein
MFADTLTRLNWPACEPLKRGGRQLLARLQKPRHATSFR